MPGMSPNWSVELCEPRVGTPSGFGPGGRARFTAVGESASDETGGKGIDFEMGCGSTTVGSFALSGVGGSPAEDPPTLTLLSGKVGPSSPGRGRFFSAMLCARRVLEMKHGSAS